MGLLRLTGSLLAVWVFLAGSAFATTPPPVAGPSPVVGPPVEVTRAHHSAADKDLAAGKKPIIVNWYFKDKQGFAHLIVNPDGTYLFSGNYRRGVPFEDLDVVLLLMTGKGRAYVFEYSHGVNTVPAGGLVWSKQGQSALLKDDFKNFAAGHTWGGAYRLTLTAKGKKAQHRLCTTLLNDNSWSWGGYGQEDWGWHAPAYCHKFDIY